MCACRLEEMQPNSSQSPLLGELEDYLHEMQSRKGDNGSEEADDIYSQLAQKEKDLILAAEIGKELLERNVDLSRQNERLTEDYSHKLELLEQEKHALRRKLESLSGESESKVADLQSELLQTQNRVAEQQALLKIVDKEKEDLVKELTEQNQRLTTELKQARKFEEQVSSQYQSLREQFNVRRSNLHDHVSQLEGLREEINLLAERKSELERRISSLMDERENLSLSLEESSDRILLLEKQRHDYETQIRNQQRDIEELRVANTQLQEKLDLVLRRSSTPNNFGHTSLYNEIEMSSQSSIEDELRSLNGSQSGRSRPHSHPGSVGFQGDDDEIECDDSELMLQAGEDDNWKLRQELLQAVHDLHRLCQDMRRQKENVSPDSGVPPSPAEIQPQEMQPGMLHSIIKDLRNVLQEILGSEGSACLACQAIIEERDLADKLRRELNEKSEELKKKIEELSEVKTKLTIKETEVSALSEERNQLREDVSNSKLAKDEIVKKAWDARDQAVARKNNVEIELAKTRIELMHINSQLMEAIQQKVELSQQLEQWQVDMQALLDERVKKQLRTQEQEDRKRKSAAQANVPQTNAKGKLFGLWRRPLVPH